MICGIITFPLDTQPGECGRVNIIALSNGKRRVKNIYASANTAFVTSLIGELRKTEVMLQTIKPRVQVRSL